MGQRIAEPGYLIVTNLATDMSLGTAYINQNIKNISPKKGTLRRTGSSPVAIEEIVGNATYMIGRMETKQSNFEDEDYEYPRTAAF